jgi:outer membrane protein
MRSVFAAFLFSVLALPAMAQPSQETLADAINSTLDNNPEAMSQRRLRSIADESLKQAKGLSLPTVSLNTTYGSYQDNLLSGSPAARPVYDRTTAGLEARQRLYGGGGPTAQRKFAEAGVVAAEARLSGFEQQLVIRVVTAFVDVRRAEQEVDMRASLVQALATQVQAATDRLSVGEVTRTDVAQAKARRAEADADLAFAQARLASARATLSRFIGRPAVQLAEPPPPPAIPASLEEALGLARAQNSTLAELRSIEKQAAAAVDVARSSLFPSLDIVANAGLSSTYYDDAFNDGNVSLVARLSIPLYQGGQAASRTREARLRADSAHFNTLSQDRLVAEEVTSAWFAVTAARLGISASASRIEAAETALDGAQQELAAGTRTTIDVLDQERELLAARLAMADIERAEYVAVMRLLAVVGRLSPSLFAQ